MPFTSEAFEDPRLPKPIPVVDIFQSGWLFLPLNRLIFKYYQLCFQLYLPIPIFTFRLLRYVLVKSAPLIFGKPLEIPDVTPTYTIVGPILIFRGSIRCRDKRTSKRATTVEAQYPVLPDSREICAALVLVDPLLLSIRLPRFRAKLSRSMEPARCKVHSYLRRRQILAHPAPR